MDTAELANERKEAKPMPRVKIPKITKTNLSKTARDANSGRKFKPGKGSCPANRMKKRAGIR